MYLVVCCTCRQSQLQQTELTTNVMNDLTWLHNVHYFPTFKWMWCYMTLIVENKWLWFFSSKSGPALDMRMYIRSNLALVGFWSLKSGTSLAGNRDQCTFMLFKKDTLPVQLIIWYGVHSRFLLGLRDPLASLHFWVATLTRKALF